MQEKNKVALAVELSIDIHTDKGELLGISVLL